MYRQAPRSLLRTAHLNLRNAQFSSRRLISTAPPHRKSRSWKSTAVRWGVAIAGIYYYNTSPIFAENTRRIMKFDTDPSQSIEENLTTVDSYSASRKQERETVAGSPEPATDAATTDDPAALEEEAESQGAFNPVTGEINWDCPCLGGMAHGPCGQEFRNAFSCFVYSEQEPKGLDCIDKFKAMQDCFRDHPDVYAAELEDDEAELDAELAKERESLNKEAAPSSADKQSKKRILDDEEPHALPISPILSADAPPTRREPSSAPKASSQQVPPQQAASHKDATSTSVSTESHPPPPVSTAASTKDDVVTDKPATKSDEESESVPKAWHDASDLNGKTTDEKKSK